MARGVAISGDQHRTWVATGMGVGVVVAGRQSPALASSHDAHGVSVGRGVEVAHGVWVGVGAGVGFSVGHAGIVT